MSMSEWAKREVEIACERERANSTEEGEWDWRSRNDSRKKDL